MENAVEALKMAFAVMAFVMALSVSMISFNNVKQVSDIVLYSKDETNYYEYQDAKGKAAENRIVGLETIIPTIYKYYKENYTVLFRQADYDSVNGTFSNVKPLPIYKTASVDKTTKGVKLWGSNKTDDNGHTYNTYEKLMNDKYSINLNQYSYSENSNKKIFSFDLQEETLRHEPWTGSNDEIRKFIDKFLNGEEFKNPNDEDQIYEYLTKNGYQTPNGFIERYKNSKFVETIGEYTYSDTEDEDGSLVKEKKKRIIMFTLINNN